MERKSLLTTQFCVVFKILICLPTSNFFNNFIDKATKLTLLSCFYVVGDFSSWPRAMACMCSSDLARTFVLNGKMVDCPRKSIAEETYELNIGSEKSAVVNASVALHSRV